MKKSNHPLSSIEHQIEERGLLVVEDKGNITAWGRSFVSPNMIIVLVHQGWMQLDYDMQPMKIQPRDNLLFMPGHLVTPHEASDDYRASLLVVSPGFLEQIRQMHPNHYHAEYHDYMVYQLTDSQYQTICACIKLLHDISLLDQPNRKDMLASQMDVAAYLAETYFQKNGQMKNHQKKRTQQLLVNFHNAVATHYKESREVGFYAEKLCMSAKHFGTVIKRETGIGAVEWIARYVLTQAKDLLLHRPDMTIQQISQELGFPDQTVFSRYFKKHEGISPTEYRRQ